MLSDHRHRPALFRVLILAIVVGCSGAVGCSGDQGANTQADLGAQSSDAAASGGHPANDATTPRHNANAAGDWEQLDRALALARKSLATLNTIRDYQCTFQRQERVGGELLEETRMEMKVRQKPFSVYMRFLEPASMAGREVIYVEGRNDGKLLAHATGLAQTLGTVALDPNGMIAMRGGRYPITDAGMTKLVEKLLALGAQKHLFRDSRITIEPVEFAERPGTRVEIRNPAPVGNFRLAVARIVLDREWNVPVHFEALEWPATGDSQPILLEKYSYLDLRLDTGLSDLDFDPKNPEYAFPE